MNSQLDLYQSFIEKQQGRTKVPIGGETQAILDYCQFVIHSQYDKKTKTKYRFKERKNQISQDFMRAFESLNRQDKIKYYNKNVGFLIRIHNNNLRAPNVRSDVLQANIYTKTHGLGRWKQRRMRLDNPRQFVYIQKRNTIKQIDLSDFIFRTSKNSKYPAFVIQAFKATVHKKFKTIHFGFESLEQMQLWAQAIQLCIDFKIWQKIYVEIYHQLPPKQCMSGSRLKESRQINNLQSNSNETAKNTQFQSKSTRQPITVASLMRTTNQPPQNQKFVQPQFKPLPKVKYLGDQLNDIQSSSQSESPQDQKYMNNDEAFQRTIIQDLVDGQCPDNNIETIQYRNLRERQNKNIRHLNIFHKMFPEYQFNQTQWEGNLEMIYNERNMRIMQNMSEKNRYKMVMQFQNQRNTPFQNIFKAICGPDFQLAYNDNIQTISVKTLISSQNSAILYMGLAPFSILYRPRDFVFIRHAFSMGQNACYIADKDIQNTNFPPFLTIVRGKYQCVWALLRKQRNRIKLIGDILMDNEGYLNENQNSNLVLNYLRGYRNLPEYVENNRQKLNQYVLFDFNWDITKNKQNQKQNQIRITKKYQRNKRKQINQPIINDFKNERPSFSKTQTNLPRQIYEQQQTIKRPQISSNLKSSFQPKPIQNEPKFVVIDEQQKQKPPFLAQKQSDRQSIKSLSQRVPIEQKISPLQKSFDRQSKMQQIELQRQKMNAGQVQAQVDPQQLRKSKLQTNKAIQVNFDSKGMVIIPKTYLKSRYQLVPSKTYPQLYWNPPGTHPLPANQWKHDTKVGGFFFTNQKKIDDQKGVLKFILSKVGKNLLSGKSILNVSLPVDIFSAKSNLQLFIDSLCYAPTLLDNLTNADPMQKYKMVTAFGLTMSTLYLQMEKPFNPILGETFQAWVHGCPAYAEQISHHPPISSLLMYGRGYTISGQLQSKAELHLNYGVGINQGILRINFDDGTKVCFSGGGGEVSGVMYGDRKFNAQGKAYVWSETLNVFAQIVYNPTKKGFFSMKKQQQPQDYFEGQVYKVTNDFIKSLENKRRPPQQKQMSGTLQKFNGVWHDKMFYGDELLLQIIKKPPYKLQYQKNPLPSDSNWREDIAYRRLMQIPRSQTQKQRLEVLQRADKKLRTKGH